VALGIAWYAAAWRFTVLLAGILLTGCVALWASLPASVIASGLFLGLLLGAA
jgi:hypothetical protein